MDPLIVTDSDVINVFDRGYVDYERFDHYCEHDIRFVSRLKENAIVEIIEEKFVEEDSPIEDDLIVILGKGRSRMERKVRVVTTQDSQGNPITIVTNVFNVSAEEISEIYRNRWQIGVPRQGCFTPAGERPAKEKGHNLAA